MATEDFTTYTEVDPGSQVAITSTRITFTDLAQNLDTYVYKDKGVNFFSGDLEHFLVVKGTVVSGGQDYVWALTNVINDWTGIADANESALGIEIFDQSGNINFIIRELDSGTEYNSGALALTSGTVYYLKVVRDEAVGTYGTIYLYVYSDSARTNLLGSKSITLHTSKKDYRYLFGTLINNRGTDSRISGYVENLAVSLTYANPTVTTQDVSAIAATTATGNGNVTSLGAPPATQHGTVWALHTNPTTDDNKTEDGVPSSTGAYTSSLTNLIQNTLYYVRSYIVSSTGTFYGQQVSFTTSDSTPVITTIQPEGVAGTNAVGRGSLGNLGGSAVTAHGVCWDTSADPDISDSKTDLGATTTRGDFYAGIINLAANTLYHVRAFATNSSGTSYGADLTFTTLDTGVPIVTTQPSTDVQPTTATGNGTIVDIGASAVTEHGHCWSTSVNPTIGGSKTTNGSADAEPFTSQITGLTAGTAYYIRAYATNTQGTSYGDNDLINSVTPTVPPGTAPGVTPGTSGVLEEHWVWVTKSGAQRRVLGTEF